MAIVQQLSVLAVRHLFEGFCSSIGFPAGAAAADAAVKFLGNRFTDHSDRMNAALGRAGTGAWRALELALAGDSWWDRVKRTVARREDLAFREQVDAFLLATPLAGLPAHPPEFRVQALRDLRAATQAGLLSAGGIDPAALAQAAGPFARFADPQALLDAEWTALDGVIASLREAKYSALAHFLSLRPHAETPMLVVAVRYFFRRELESDTRLSTALSFARLERLAEKQEAGYDALQSALDRNGDQLATLLDGAVAVLEEVHAVVHQTHSDVQDIKAALGTMNQTLFQTLSNQAQAAAPGEPARKEVDIRLEVIDSLLTTPHRQLMPLWPIHQELCAKDPRFYHHLAAWYADKGEVRDHKEMFVVTLSLSEFPGHRDVGLALLRTMPPYQVARVVDFIHGRKETRRKTIYEGVERVRGSGRHSAKRPPVARLRVERQVVGDFGLFRNVPRSLKTEVVRYLAEREANPEWFDSVVMTARRSLKRLYTVLHVRPGERAQKVLFDNDPPADSRLAVLKAVVQMTDPEAQAIALVEARVPFRVAVSVVSTMGLPVLRALIERMTPQEVINSLNMLRRHGALADAELKLMVDLKLEEARSSRKVSTFKADVALKAVEGDEGLRQKLEQVADDQIKAKGKLRRSTAILVDKSGSMDMCIDLGKRIAAMVSTVCEKELYVYAFDTMAYTIVSKGRDWASWMRAFEGILSGGETSVGIAVELMRRRKQAVEQLIVITDEEEYNLPFFVSSLLKYRQELGIDPALCFVKVPDSSTRLEEQCKRAGLAYTVFSFDGDYYSLPNLISLLEPPSQMDLLMEIMEYPLPERKG